MNSPSIEVADCIRVLSPAIAGDAGKETRQHHALLQLTYLEAASVLRDRLSLANRSVGILVETSAETSEWKMVYTQREMGHDLTSVSLTPSEILKPIARRSSALVGAPDTSTPADPFVPSAASPIDVMQQLQGVEDVAFLGSFSSFKIDDGNTV